MARRSRVGPDVDDYRALPGDRGKVMRAVFGHDDEEFDAICAYEAAREAKSAPASPRFRNKIGRRFKS